MTATVRRARRSDLALLWHQVRYEQLSFWRNPQSAFFTFVFPVVIITVFGALLGGAQQSSYFYGLSALQYYVPTMAAVSVLGACYSQLAIVLSMRRQNGILKRVRATPLPAWTYFLGLLAHCVMVSIVDVALIAAVGRLFGVPLPTQWAAIFVTLVLGAASFCALGVAVATLIRNSEAAPPVVQLVLFPLVFISGTYMPIHSATLNRVGRPAAGAAVQSGLAGPIRPPHRVRLAQPGGAARVGRGRGSRGHPQVPVGSAPGMAGLAPGPGSPGPGSPGPGSPGSEPPARVGAEQPRWQLAPAHDQRQMLSRAGYRRP